MGGVSHTDRSVHDLYLTPLQLAREVGLERRTVVLRCLEWGIPIVNGRISKRLFVAAMKEPDDA